MQNFQAAHQSLKTLDKKTLEYVLNDPVYFFHLVKHKRPFNYQEDLLRADRDVIFKAGRQVGKSTVAGVSALHTAYTVPKSCTVIFSAAQRQSTLMFREIRTMIRENAWLEHHLVSNSSTSLEFDHGGVIYALPAPNEGASIRGFSPNKIILEEMAFMKDTAIDAIMPMKVSTGAQVIAISSPFGQRGAFYTMWTKSNMIKLDVPTRLNPLVKQSYLDEERKRMTIGTYKREYEGVFDAQEGGYFPSDLILNCVNDQFKHSKDTHTYFLGVDCARQGADETVYTVTAFDGVNYQVVEIQNQPKNYMNEVVGRIKYLHDIYNFKRIYVDTLGLGSVMDMFREMPEVPIEHVPFTQVNKEKLYPNCKHLMEQGRLKYLTNDKLLNQMSELQCIFSSNGHMSFHHPDNGFDDYPDSLVLSVYANYAEGDQEVRALDIGIDFTGSLNQQFDQRGLW